MKRSLLLPIVLSCFLFSCGSNDHANESTATQDGAVPPMTEMAAMRVAGADTIPAPNGYLGHLYRVSKAIGAVSRYKTSQKSVSQFSFVFNTQELINYLNATHNSIVSFIVGQNQADDSLFLFLATVDEKGENDFYTRNDTCYLLSAGNSMNIPTQLEAQQVNVIDTYFIEAMNLEDAQSMIDNYQSSYTSLRKRNNGWLYNAHDLTGYLQAGIASGGMQYTQFILALDGNNMIHLVIVGSNDGTNHMYMGYNGQSSVMENTLPCPTCNTVSGGSTFDPPKCAN